MTGFLMIAVSLVMVILGFQLLNLFPWLRRLQPKMPKFLAHKIHDASGSGNRGAPFFLGASTFFLPCGFTQALQLYILTKGSFTVGALTMLAFSLGTLPALASLGALSSFVKGSFQKHFLRFAGALVVLLGLFNVNNGLALTGSSFDLARILNPSRNEATGQAVEIVDGRQIVSMKIAGLEYVPSNFTLIEGVPVEWRIDGTEAVSCAKVVVAPGLGITAYVQGEKLINFTPEKTGTFTFSCPMGMTTRGASFTVVPNTEGVVGNSGPSNSGDDEINRQIAAGNVQKVFTEVTEEEGFVPFDFTIKKDVPVELTVDAKIELGGCFSVMVIPEFGVTMQMKLGENRAVFNPTEAGIAYLTCSMGSRVVRFTVE